MAKIQFFSPSGSRLFVLSVKLLEPPFNFYRNEEVWGIKQYSTLRKAAVLVGLYEFGAKVDKSFDKATWTHTAPGSPRWMPVSFFQTGAGLSPVYDRHEAYLYSDIRESSSTVRLRRRNSHYSCQKHPIFLVDGFLKIMPYLSQTLRVKETIENNYSADGAQMERITSNGRRSKFHPPFRSLESNHKVFSIR